VIGRYVLIAGFFLLSVGIAVWLVHNLMDYAFATIDCADQKANVANCVRQAHKIVLLRSLGGIAVWSAITWLVFRWQTQVREAIGCIVFGLLGLGVLGYFASGMLGAFIGDCADDDVCHEMQSAHANYILVRAAAAGLLICIAYALYRRFIRSRDV
jgi:hypothetical protein